jgi:fatty-acyl-CoA synthase
LLHDIWALVERYRVSFMSAVPTIYAALLDIPSEGRDLSSLRFALCGAASLPVEVLRQFELRTGVQIVEGYGLTEGTCGTSCNPPEGERRAGSVGLRLPYCETRIVVRDSTGAHVRDAVTDEIGQVCLRGPTVFRGYLHMEACADHWIEGGWFNTGDLGRIDAQGYLWLTGRSKDVIIRGGHNIDPQAIEEILYRHPAVAMAAAVGKPDVRVGELPVAYVQLKPGAQADEAELIEHAANQLSERAAVPKNIWLLEAMPLTAVGKIYKPCLRMDAVRRVLQHDVDAMGIPLHIDVLPDERHGQKARLIGTLDQGGRAALAEKLGGYAVHLEWVDTH